MRLLLLAFSIFLSLAAPAAEAADKVPGSTPEMQLSFAPVVKTASSAVVNIYTKKVVKASVSPFAADPFFSQFFGRNQMAPRVQNALGSGVILSSDGIIVSNHHLVGDADEIRVVLSDRREFDAKVVMSDAAADLAVLKLNGTSDLPSLQLADSDKVQVGDLVLAIGNPFGVGQTVSSGIISGLARSGGMAGGRARYFIQTDAPINPGNSGGALVDMAGRLIGINTQILTRSGGSNGIGFAIPANLVRQYLKQVEAGRTAFAKPWSGVRGQAVEWDVATALGEKVPAGMLISAIHPESPLVKAGLKAGDVILSVSGQPVNAPEELEYRLATLGVGGSATVIYLRNGAEAEASMALAEAPEDAGAAPVRVRAQNVFDGLLTQNVTPKVIDDLGLPLDARGVVVLETGGYSVQSGLQPGDVIQAVNGTPVSSAQELARALSGRQRILEIDSLRDGQLLRMQFRG